MHPDASEAPACRRTLELTCDLCGRELSFAVSGFARIDPLNYAAELLNAHAREAHGVDVLASHRATSR